MSDEFVSAAPPSSGIQWGELKGKLLVIKPLGVETEIQTTFGLSDAVRADVHVLTSPEDAEVHTDTLVFPKLLQSQLRGQIGKTVVGRLGSGTAKPNQSPPHILEEATPDDLAKAKAYIEKQSKPAVTSAQAPF